jgi:hypothetical protein
MNRKAGRFLDQPACGSGRVKVVAGQDSSVGNAAVLHQLFLRVMRYKTDLHCARSLLSFYFYVSEPLQICSEKLFISSVFFSDCPNRNSIT